MSLSIHDLLAIRNSLYECSVDERDFDFAPAFEMTRQRRTDALELLDKAIEAKRQLRSRFDVRIDDHPCPGCLKGNVCRTPSCGRLKLPVDHPLRI